jgi:peptidoglycan pentaglycine glycine transferase (the first glycine)
MKLIEITDQARWDELVNNHPYGHPLQLWGWGELKRLNRWLPYRVALEHKGELVAGMQILMLPIPGLRRRVAYVPRGPVADPQAAMTRELLTQATAFARSQQALFLTLEPAWFDYQFPKGWLKSRQHVLLPQTYILDLNPPETELFANLRPTMRNLVRAGERHDIEIFDDTNHERLDDFWRIYQQTAKRARFGLHTRDYYTQLARELGARSHLKFALVDGRAESFSWVVTGGPTAIELYAGSTEVGSKHNANYLLKWRMITAMKAVGCVQYDFNGRLNDGISKFKAGFGPEAATYVGSFDFPFHRGRYALWKNVLPVAKSVSRRVKPRPRREKQA